MATTAEKLQQLRLERQKTDLTRQLQAVQADLEKSEKEKSQIAEECTNKIKQALSLLDNARKEIDKLKTEKNALLEEVTELRCQNEAQQTNGREDAASNQHGAGHPGYHGSQSDSHPDHCDNKTSALPDGPKHKSSDKLTDNQQQVNGNSGTRGVRRISKSTRNDSFANSVVPESAGVVRRRKKEEEDRPLSLAERMSMFENKSAGGRNFGAPNSGNSPNNRKSWRDNAPPKINIRDAENEEKKENEAKKNDVMLRAKKNCSKSNTSNRYTMPPNMFSQSNNQQSAPPPSISINNNADKATPKAAESGKAKLGRAVAGIRGAIETEKRHKGIEPKQDKGFLGLINQVAPKAGATVKRAHSVAAPGSASAKKQALIYWCQKMTEGKPHCDIRNFSSSWNNGMAFCALFHHFIPDQIPYETLDPKNREYNFRLAFTEGEKAGVTALLDVEDMVEMKNPDWMSVMTYISLIYNHFNGIRVGGPRLPAMPNQ